MGRGLLEKRLGASWRLACLLLALVALPGHVRRDGGPVPVDLEDVLAEVVLARDGMPVARGSAVVVASRDEGGQPACYLLTVGHVVSPASGSADVLVVLSGNGKQALPAELMMEVDSEEHDLAVIRAIAPTCRPVVVGASVEQGADVWLAGFPAPGALQLWPGHVRRMPPSADAIWTIDGAVSEGASGGGVFDARTGGLVGLIQGYWTVRLDDAAGSGDEAAAGTTAVIPLAGVRALLREWGFEELLGN